MKMTVRVSLSQSGQSGSVQDARHIRSHCHEQRPQSTMDAVQAAHDGVLLKLEQPQRQHLLDDVRNLGHHAHIATPDEQPASEKTPLIVKAGKQRVYIDADVDLKELDKKLHDEESAAIEADRHAPLHQILKEEAASLALLSIPITFTIILEILPMILVSMMIGIVSGDDSPRVLAASSLSDFFQGQGAQSVANGLGAAVATMCSQAFGAKQYTQMWIYAQAGLVACIYSLVPLMLISFNGSNILRLLGQDAELARIAGNLIVISFCALPFMMIYTITRTTLQAQNIALPFVVTSFVSTTIGITVGYSLGTRTSLGYLGIALGTLVSQVLKAITCIPILLKNDLFVSEWPGWQWREAHNRARALWPVGAGSVLLVTFQSAGFTVVSVLCGYLPNAATVMSASSIATTMLLVAFIPMIGVAATGTVRVGNALGAGQARRASLTGGVVIVAMLSVAAVGVILSWLSASAYVHIFTSDEPTIQLAIQLIKHLLLLIPLAGIVLASQSIFQACGAQWLCAKMNFLFLFAIGAPLGLLLAIPFKGGVFGLWNGNIVGSIAFMVAAGVWLYRLDWHKTAHEARLNAHLHVDREPSTEPALSESTSSSVVDSNV